MFDELYEPLIGAIKDDNGKKKKGISNQKMCIGIALTSNGVVRLRYIGRGHPQKADIDKIWGDLITEETLIIHDANTCYDFKGHKEKICNSKIKEEEQLLNPMNAICSSVDWYWKKHHGIIEANVDLYISIYEY